MVYRFGAVSCGADSPATFWLYNMPSGLPSLAGSVGPEGEISPHLSSPLLSSRVSLYVMRARISLPPPHPPPDYRRRPDGKSGGHGVGWSEVCGQGEGGEGGEGAVTWAGGGGEGGGMWGSVWWCVYPPPPHNRGTHSLAPPSRYLII